MELTFADTPVTISKNGQKTFICNPIGEISPKELGEKETYTSIYEFIVNMSVYYGNLEMLLIPEKGFTFDDASTESQNTKVFFMSAVSNVFGGWGSTSERDVLFTISIPGVGQFSYQATLTEVSQEDGSSDDAGNTGNDGGAGETTTAS